MEDPERRVEEWTALVLFLALASIVIGGLLMHYYEFLVYASSAYDEFAMVLIITPAALAFLSLGSLSLAANITTLVVAKVYKGWSDVPLLLKVIAGIGWAAGALILVLILVSVTFVLILVLPPLLANR